MYVSKTHTHKDPWDKSGHVEQYFSWDPSLKPLDSAPGPKVSRIWKSEVTWYTRDSVHYGVQEFVTTRH